MLRKIRSVPSRSLSRDQSKKSDRESESPSVIGNLFFASSINHEQKHENDENIKIIWLTTNIENIDEHSFMKSLRSVSENILVRLY